MFPAEGALVLTIRLLADRWHGEADWPPSPFRVLQALVAAAANGDEIAPDARAALQWVERHPLPFVAVPPAKRGSEVSLYVPNNDLDTVGGDPARIGEIRGSKKCVCPQLFDGHPRFLFLWPIEPDDTPPTESLARIADRLTIFGRGIDLAFAQVEQLGPGELEQRLAGLDVYRPGRAGRRRVRVAADGSLDSLLERYRATRQRFDRRTFRKPPPARFRLSSYECPPAYLGFELRDISHDPPAFARWPLCRVAELVERVRDRAANILRKVHESETVDLLVIGRGAGPADLLRRLRIIPLPSIGHEQVTPAIRRLLVEVPRSHPLPLRDLEAALGMISLDRVDERTGEVSSEIRLVPEDVSVMARHYGMAGHSAHVWRTATPAALPAARRGGRHTGAERRQEEAAAVRAVTRALGHAGVRCRPRSIRVQREPFERRGQPADSFAHGRFPADRLWHVEIAFDALVNGPMVIGDGRFLGLGLMYPNGIREAVVWSVDDLAVVPRPTETALLLRHVRRAVMAIARQTFSGVVPKLFSGHEEDGTPARSGSHEHVFFVFLPGEGENPARILMLAPWLVDRELDWTHAQRQNAAREICAVAEQLKSVKAGPFGVLRLKREGSGFLPPELTEPSAGWRSCNYRPSRHLKKDPETALEHDLVEECRRRGLPRPEELVIAITEEGPRPSCTVELRFGVPVAGPIILGAGAHFGEGVFRRVR